MGDSPLDPPPADDRASRPSRSRPAGRDRAGSAAGRGGTGRGGQRAAGPPAAGGRRAAGPRAAGGRGTAARAGGRHTGSGADRRGGDGTAARTRADGRAAAGRPPGTRGSGGRAGAAGNRAADQAGVAAGARAGARGGGRGGGNAARAPRAGAAARGGRPGTARTTTRSPSGRPVVASRGPGSRRGPSTLRPPSPRPARPGRAPASNTPIVVLSVLTVVVVSLVVYAFVLRPSEQAGTGTGGTSVTSTTIDPEAPGTTLPESDFFTYTSDAEGFSIKHPATWTYLSVGDEGGMALDAGGGDAVDVRLLQRTEVPTTAENLENVKAFTDGVVGTNPTAVILKQQAITLNGMPGYYYLYTFTEPETGAQGAHAHYFLFRGRNMYTLVFQALPDTGFSRLSGVFDQMAASFQTRPDTGQTPATTTTAPAG